MSIKKYPSPPILICMLSLCFYCSFCPHVTPRELFHFSVWVLEQNTNTRLKKSIGSPSHMKISSVPISHGVLKARWYLHAWWWWAGCCHINISTSCLSIAAGCCQPGPSVNIIRLSGDSSWENKLYLTWSCGNLCWWASCFSRQTRRPSCPAGL